MAVISAYMVPHPPMIVPAVGRGDEARVRATTESYDKVAQEIASLKPETIVVISPHSVLYAGYFHLSPGSKASGSFARFGAARVSFKETYDTAFVERVSALSDAEGLPAGTLGERDRSLDHGTLVPLYFIRKYYQDFKLVRLGLSGLPLTDHYRLGRLIGQAADELARRTVVVGMLATSM